jgi:serine/threonine protein kinase/GTPase SAR1 family protein
MSNFEFEAVFKAAKSADVEELRSVLEKQVERGLLKKSSKEKKKKKINKRMMQRRRETLREKVMETRNDDGDTPLLCSVRNGRPENVLFLATEYAADALVRVRKSNGSAGDSALRVAVDLGDKQTIIAVLDALGMRLEEECEAALELATQVYRAKKAAGLLDGATGTAGGVSSSSSSSSLSNPNSNNSSEGSYVGGSPSLTGLSDFGSSLTLLSPSPLTAGGSKSRRDRRTRTQSVSPSTSRESTRSSTSTASTSTAVGHMPDVDLEDEGPERLMQEHALSETRDAFASMVADVGELDLSDCGMSIVPEATFFVQSLRVLNLADNELRAVSDNVRHLTLLQELDVSGNAKIDYLPPDLGFMKRLSKMRVRDCELGTIPESVKWEFVSNDSSQMTAKALKDYLRFLRQETSWKVVKLMFLGQERVGKTSLIRALTGKSSFGYSGPGGDTLSTEGIDVGEWKLSDVTFSVWDFGGQSVFYPTHQFFMTSRSVYVLVFNVARQLTESRVEYWLKKVNVMTTGRTPTLLVGTHIDAEGMGQEQLDAIGEKMRRKYPRSVYPNIVDIVMVSTKGKKPGIKSLKKLLRETARKTKGLTRRVPGGYRDVQTQILSMRKERQFIQFDEFVELIAAHGLRRDEVKSALSFFHQVGSLVYFDDPHAGLDQLVIIDPEWLSKVMASVVTFSNNYVQRGILEHSHLKQVWASYPETLWPTLLALLERFEVAYPWPSSVGGDGAAAECRRSIIPSMLPQQKPFDVLRQRWPSLCPEGLIEYGRVYQFQFVPMGFFGRLLMRLIRMPQVRVHHDVCWATGAVVWKNGQVALLEIDDSTYRLAISVRTAPLGSTDAARHVIDDAAEQAIDAAAEVAARDADDALGIGHASIFDMIAAEQSQRQEKHKRKSKKSSSSSSQAASSSSPSSSSSSNQPTSSQPASQVQAASVDSGRQLLKHRKHVESQTETNLLRSIVEIIEPLIEHYYPKLAPTTRRTLPCQHCLQLRDPLVDNYMFTYEECVDAVESGRPFVYCCGLPSRPVRIDMLAPDIVFSDISLIENYDIIKALGTGGFGTVYKAKMRDGDGIHVAVKELNFASSSATPEERTEKFNEFQREVYIMSCLDCAYLVKLYGISLQPRLRMVMEFIDGGDLYHLLRDKKLTDDDLTLRVRLQVAYDVAAGMAYLHTLNPSIVHCDLRSPNIFLRVVRADGALRTVRAKVADFGLSRRVFAGTTGFLNTWQWMAPEILDLDSQSFDERADVYSFAIVMWETLTRRFPFEEFDEFKDRRVDAQGKEHMVLRERAIKNAIINEHLRPTIPANTPKPLAKLIRRCWDRDADERPPFPSVAESLAAMLADDHGVDVHAIEHELDSPDLDSANVADRSSAAPLVQVTPSTSYMAAANAAAASSSLPSSSSNKPADERHDDAAATSQSLAASSSSSSGACAAPADGTVVAEHSVDLPVAAISMCYVNKRLWIGSDEGHVFVVDTDAWALVTTLKEHSKRINSIVQVDQHVWAGSDDGKVTIVDASANGSVSHTFTAHPGGMVRSICWFVPRHSAQADRVWTCSPVEQTVTVWNPTTVVATHSFYVEKPTTALVQHRDMIWLAALTDLIGFDAISLQLLFCIPAHEAPINHIISVPTLNQVWSAGNDRTVRVWAGGTGAQIRTLRAARSKVYTLDFVGQRHVWSGDFDTTILIFDATTHRPVQELQEHTDSIRCLEWIHDSPGARLVVSAGRDASLKIWKYNVDLPSPGANRLPAAINFAERSEAVRTYDKLGSSGKSKSSSSSSSSSPADGKSKRKGLFGRRKSKKK